jgi:hypothetical protein
MDRVQKLSNPELYTIIRTLQKQVPFKNRSFFKKLEGRPLNPTYVVDVLIDPF